MEESPTQEQLQEIWDEEVKLQVAGPDAEPSKHDYAPEETLPLETETEPESKATIPEEIDPFASMPDAVKAKFAEIDDLKQFNQQLLQQVKTAEGRVSAMQRDFDIAKNTQNKTAPGSAPSSTQLLEAAQNPEEWEQMKSDFPDLANAWEKKMAAELARINVQQQGISTEEVGNFVRGQMETVRAETRRLVEEARIEGKYEDWRDIVNTSDFATWYAVQKPEVKALADSTAAKDAVRMLDLFQDAKANTATAIKQDRNQRLQAAAGAPPRSRNAPPARSVDDMTPEELWKYEANKRIKERAERGF